MATKFLNDTGLAYFWSKIKSWVTGRGYITSSGSITGNAGTATKLATARNISAGNLEFQGSANFDGSGNIALNVTNHRSIVSVGNTNNYPFHRIAYIPTLTGNYLDKGITFLVSKDFSGGGWGICRIILRTNNATGGQTAQCNVQWLVCSDEISADSIQVGFCNTANASYIDVFYKSAGTYHSAVCRVLAHANGRSFVGRGFTVVSASTEANSTTATDPKTSIESYKTIADAGTALHNKAYTNIIAASNVGVVNNAAIASAIAWSGITSKPTTIAGYGITDAKIANGTITLGSNSITPLTSVPSHNQASNTINAMTGYSKPSAGSAIAASDTLNSAIGKLEAKVDAVDDSNYVHKTGDETITGLKVFNDNLEVYGINDDITTIGLKSNIISIGEDPATDVQFRIIMSDQMSTLAGHRFGIFRTFVYTNGDVASLMEAFQNVSSNQVHTAISVVVKKDGTKYATAPSTLSSRSEGTDILTRDWIPNDTRIVHTSGDESISGIKTFTSDIVTTHHDVRTVSDADFIVLNGGAGESQYRAGRLALYGKDYPDASSVDTTMAGYFNLSSTDGTNVYKLVGSRSGTLTWRSNNIMAGLTTTGSGNAITALSIGANNVVTATKGSTFLTSHQSLANYVTLNSVQTITATKKFSGDLDLLPTSNTSSARYVDHINSSFTRGTAPSGNAWHGYRVLDKNEKSLTGFQHVYHSDASVSVRLTLDVSDSISKQILFRCYTNGSNNFYPDATGDCCLGYSAHKWKEVWCTQSSMNSSSDERMKTKIGGIPDGVLDAWESIEWLQYKFIEAEQEKGENARYHTGTVAQRVDKAFRAKGLDASEYGLFLYDEWEETPEEKDEKGHILQPYHPAGNSYGLRYVEALCMEAAYMRRENARLKKRVSDLEDRLAALELRLGSE